MAFPVFEWVTVCGFVVVAATCSAQAIEVVAYPGTEVPDGAAAGAFTMTDFGSVAVAGGEDTNQFIIMNVGGPTLNITGAINVSGAHAGDFSVTQPNLTAIHSGSQAFFNVTFNPTATGERTAIVTIPHDGPNENPYNFTVKGTGAGAISLGETDLQVLPIHGSTMKAKPPKGGLPTYSIKASVEIKNLNATTTTDATLQVYQAYGDYFDPGSTELIYEEPVKGIPPYSADKPKSKRVKLKLTDVHDWGRIIVRVTPNGTFPEDDYTNNQVGKSYRFF